MTRARRPHRLARIAIVALALTAAATLHPAVLRQAAAQEPASEDDKALAQQLYQRASEAYSQAEYDQAIEWLERAYALDPDPVILYNLGRSYEGAAQLDKAQETLSAVEQDPNAPDELRQRARTDLKRVANLLAGTLQQGQLTVTTSPDKARLFIDGREEGSTPFAGALPVGEHTILLQKDGFESLEQKITVEKNKTVALDLSLLSLTALEDETPTGLYIGGGVALGVGVIGLGVGIGTAMAALEIHRAHCDDPDAPERDWKHGGKCDGTKTTELDEGETLSTVSLVSYGIGGVSAAVGAGLLIWALVEDLGAESDAPAAQASAVPTIDLDPSRGTVTLGWTW